METSGRRIAYWVMDGIVGGIDGAPTPYEHFYFGSLIAEFPERYRIRISKGLDPSAMLIAPEEWTYSDTEDLPDAVRGGDGEAVEILGLSRAAPAPTRPLSGRCGSSVRGAAR